VSFTTLHCLPVTPKDKKPLQSNDWGGLCKIILWSYSSMNTESMMASAQWLAKYGLSSQEEKKQMAGLVGYHTALASGGSRDDARAALAPAPEDEDERSKREAEERSKYLENRMKSPWGVSNDDIDMLDLRELLEHNAEECAEQMKPGYLSDSHGAEIVENSGVSEEIATANFYTITNQAAVAKLLQWRDCPAKAPGWVVSGVDPATGERSLAGVQFKADIPIQKDGKPQKYLSARTASSPLFLGMPDKTYWSNIFHTSKPIFITEGAKKAGCLLSMGYAAISLPGVWMGQENGILREALQQFCKDGREVYLAFDSDLMIKPQVMQALHCTGNLLRAEGCDVRVMLWEEQYKGIDDLAVDGGTRKVRDAVSNAISFDDWVEQNRDSLDTRPKVQLRSGHLEEVSREVLKVLGEITDPRDRVYYQGNGQGHILIRVLRAVADVGDRYLHISKDNDTLEPLALESLQREINRSVQLFRLEVRNGKSREHKVDCPVDLAKHIFAMGRWPQLQQLSGISHLPLLTKMGEIVSEPGYDSRTKHLLQFNPEDFQTKSNPTKEGAIEALRKLQDLLSEFCFGSELDKSAAIAMLLTSVSRKLYPLAPLFAVSAHQPGTGKGTLVSLASILATGNKAAGVTNFTDEDSEMGKRVLASLLSGVPIVNIDNITKRLGGGTLEAVLTTEFYSQRILGVNKNAVCSTQVLWTANGNNLSFTPDMARRTILIELDAKVENPEARSFSRDVEAFALENRGELVSACLTILQAYLLSGTDEDFPALLGSFGQWDAVVRRSLLWLGMPDPVQTQAVIKEGDDSRISLSLFLESWYQEFQGIPQLGRELIVHAQNPGCGADFRMALLDICCDRAGNPQSKFLGYYLKRNAGVVVNGYRLVKKPKAKHGVPWLVEKTEENIVTHRHQPETLIGTSIQDLAKPLGDDGDDVSGRSEKMHFDKSQIPDRLDLSSPSSPPNNQIQSPQGLEAGDDKIASSPPSLQRMSARESAKFERGDNNNEF
jgi:hypothetical protein